ncbi:MAG: hypothetical protein AAF228_12645 [Pseudomonadota bacterium]
MSQKYKIADYDETRDRSGADNASGEVKGQEIIKGQCFELGQSLGIDFIMVDGARQSFAYSYLITFRLEAQDETQKLSLFFTTHWVYVTGYCLDMLYAAIQERTLSVVKQGDERYSQLTEKNGDDPLVTTIEIEWK